MTDENLLSLVGDIYRTATDAGRWPKVLAQICSRVNGANAALLLHDRLEEDVPFFADYGFDPGLWERYRGHYCSTDLWVKGVEAGRPSGVVTGGDLVQQDVFLKSEWYNDFLKGIDIGQILSGCQWLSRRNLFSISIYRPLDAVESSPQDIACLEALLPHLSQAFQQHLLWKSGKIYRHAFEDSLEHLPMPCFLLDRRGRICFANGLGLAHLRRRDGLMDSGGRLAACNGKTNDRLQAMLHNILAIPSLAQSAGGAICIPRRPGRLPYAIRLSPIVCPPEMAMSGSDTVMPRVLVFVHDPELSSVPNVAFLMEAFELTGAEARLAATFANYASLSKSAKALGITEGTARQYVKQIFQKTDTRSQAELMKLLQSISLLGH